MEILDNPINTGLNAAVERTQNRFTVTSEQLVAVRKPLDEALARWPDQLHPDFIVLFVELWAVAATARIANEEKALNDEQIYDFLGQCTAYFNSFLHR